MTSWIRHATALASFVAAAAVQAAGLVGNTLPAGFPSIEDTSLARPLIGFGAAGPVTRTPVIFIHGNNDTPQTWRAAFDFLSDRSRDKDD